MTTKFFKGQKSSKKSEVVPVPREFAEIQKEYMDLRGRAGELQYQIFVLNKDLASTNDALVGLNHEAAARQKLDKDAAAKPVEEVPSAE